MKANLEVLVTPRIPDEQVTHFVNSITVMRDELVKEGWSKGNAEQVIIATLQVSSQ